MDTCKPLISLSVVSHGDAEKVRDLLESLSHHEEAELIQVLVTNNLPETFERGEDSRWYSLEVIQNSVPLGFAHNHNHAFSRASGDFFCVLNPDILFVEAIFSKLIMWLSQKSAVITPLIFDSNGHLQDSFRALPTPLRLLERKLPFYKFVPLQSAQNGLVEPDWIAGMFMLMRREVYKQLGGFDEKFFLYFEDVDFCTRARAAGLPVWVDTDVKIVHNAQRESRRNPRYFFWHLHSAAKFFRSGVYKEAR